MLLVSSQFAAAGESKAYDELCNMAAAAGIPSAFTDWTPAQGASSRSKLPAEAYGAGMAGPAAAPDRAVAYTAAQAKRLSAMANEGLTLVKSINGGMDRQDQYHYSGVPSVVTRVSPAEVGVKRHWTSNAQYAGVPVVDLIVKSGLLKAGPRPYIIPESHRADYYSDLHGVFFTTPEFDPSQLWMGLGADSDYVDFVVDPGMGALYLAPGNYLFPCPQNTQTWIRDAYSKWKGTGVMPKGMEGIFAQIDSEGGLQDAIDVPITVVRYQKNGKVKVLRPDLLGKP
ncbi:MAG: hypothetical protein A2X34_08490 [Elusimicrobia bacterium GWC2_51_8]|nr:MAG: hypothetical protein A2X33_10925 [Elusimicrobia bacterium GWA2_51_34]OGR60721.1 MAG: hypothetical protein A2X34_08490 [Elusimicrobia bacterium GWC2_51_8]HAF95069.1 hypothetical protein [Elusimicrobiota bacterium]HCE98460.1 hypothetical protein [Elusimicrobiota bacterium]